MCSYRGEPKKPSTASTSLVAASVSDAHSESESDSESNQIQIQFVPRLLFLHRKLYANELNIRPNRRTANHPEASTLILTPPLRGVATLEQPQLAFVLAATDLSNHNWVAALTDELVHIKCKWVNQTGSSSFFYTAEDSAVWLDCGTGSHRVKWMSSSSSSFCLSVEASTVRTSSFKSL